MIINPTIKTNYRKQTLTELKKEIDNSTVSVGDFNTSTSIKNRTRHKFNREIEDLNNTINHINVPSKKQYKLYNCT